MNTALLVIDVQCGLAAGRYACFDAAGVIERINLVTTRARAAGVPVFLIQHEDEHDDLLRHGSAGWQLAEGLLALPSDIRLRKTVTDAFVRTDLHEQLQARGAERLVVCGMQSDFCVTTTTLSAMRLGYPVTLVADAHTTLDNGLLTAAQIIAHQGLTLASIDSYGVRTTLRAAQDLRFAG